ncbi:hypothetical protein EJ03DRAFT_330356 [Teratosphaeria nubilosa]|uniref:Uncharacterized protein n=1 Tax=Teratosphaeria nubilosa TaxID=161662 RepID=A0A6G1L0T1_9PEZI|nr:hypothetical protein EJ03DRAFT_330356 [Teratosphaeria nubilosa]
MSKSLPDAAAPSDVAKRDLPSSVLVDHKEGHPRTQTPTRTLEPVASVRNMDTEEAKLLEALRQHSNQGQTGSYAVQPEFVPGSRPSSTKPPVHPVSNPLSYAQVAPHMGGFQALNAPAQRQDPTLRPAAMTHSQAPGPGYVTSGPTVARTSTETQQLRAGETPRHSPYPPMTQAHAPGPYPSLASAQPHRPSPPICGPVSRPQYLPPIQLQRQSSQSSQSTYARKALTHMQKARPRYPVLKPAPLQRPAAPQAPPKTNFYDLPAELRVEVYKLALSTVCIHIGPLEGGRRSPHPLVLTSHLVRMEVLPLMHSLCPIRASVTDFNFSGLLAWTDRIPPNEHATLAKNQNLTIVINSTEKSPKESQFGPSLRKWLHRRADPHRAQPNWRYQGPPPQKGVASDMKRRAKRMTEEGKRKELVTMLTSLGVQLSR